ncbi:MAG TPA: hypothetical protein VF755_14710 [Catenuloplanes sp.]|jgi:hypothetical protein
MTTTAQHTTTGHQAGAAQHGKVDALTHAHQALRRGIRDELALLVGTRAVLSSCANDILTRLDLPPLRYDFVVGARVPVTVTVTASTARYAETVAAAQIVADLRGLHRTYLRGRTPSATATEQPIRDAVVAVRTMRVAGDPTRPTLARFTIDARVLLGAAVTAPERRDAWAAAQQLVAAELRRLRPGATRVHTDALTLTFVRDARTVPHRPHP